MRYVCPHCGCVTGSINVHSGKCPVLHRDRYYAVLNRGDGYIITQLSWERISGTHGLLSLNTLRTIVGTKQWGDIAAYFGLGFSRRNIPKNDGMTPEERKAARAALDAPLTEAERHACRNRGTVDFSGTQGLRSHWSMVDIWTGR